VLARVPPAARGGRAGGRAGERLLPAGPCCLPPQAPAMPQSHKRSGTAAAAQQPPPLPPPYLNTWRPSSVAVDTWP
jgi:hypothetical protein